MNKDRRLPSALRAAYMAIHRSSDSVFAEHGVTADQFVLLLALKENTILTQSELATRIWSDSSTVRAMLVLLEKNGYVKRESHPTDFRAKVVTLTAKGKRKISTLWKAGQPIRNKMYGCLSDNESEILIELLMRLSGALDRDRFNTP